MTKGPQQGFQGRRVCHMMTGTVEVAKVGDIVALLGV